MTNEANVIWIDDDYGISSAPNNIVLVKRTVVQTGKHKGETNITNIGYYSTLSGLYQGYMKQQENISVDTQKSIEGVLNRLDNMSKKAIVGLVAYKCNNAGVEVV